MRSLTSSWSLCGLAGHKVTAVAAVVMCHFLLTSARSAPEDNGPLTMLTPGGAETEVDDKAVESANHRAIPKVMVEAQKRMEERGMTPDLYKRFIQGFVGSRGKRAALMDDLMHGRGMSEDALSKRFIQGFVGSRGKRVLEGGDSLPMAASVFKRFMPGGYHASRGKRYMPAGLQALWHSQLHQKRNERKRQLAFMDSLQDEY